MTSHEIIKTCSLGLRFTKVKHETFFNCLFWNLVWFYRVVVYWTDFDSLRQWFAPKTIQVGLRGSWFQISIRLWNCTASVQSSL